MIVGEAWELSQEEQTVPLPPESKAPDITCPGHDSKTEKDNVGKALAIMAVGAAVGVATLVFVRPEEPYRIFLLSIGGVIAGRGFVELLL